jgi:hypothetical protein
MQKVEVTNAIGKKLCHDITAVKDGFKGVYFKRGHIIKEEDIAELLNLGKRHVYIWEENAGEIHEEDAAIRLANMNKLDNAHYTDVSEGKTVLISDVAGMFKLDSELLFKINMIGDITIVTLPDHYPVEVGTRVASMRIIPLVTKEEQIIKAENMCKGIELYKIYPYKHKKVGVVITGYEVFSGRIKDKFEPVIREKLKNYPCDIIGVTICNDDVYMIEEEARKFIELGAELLVFTGGMSVDPDDITPSAISRLGGDIITRGVPAQPGNMTLLSYIGNVTAVGVPGAAISCPTTVLDILLPQIFTDLKFKKEDLVRLGAGGLYQFDAPKDFPNIAFGRY